MKGGFGRKGMIRSAGTRESAIVQWPEAAKHLRVQSIHHELGGEQTENR